ncbi:hypothetical protein [Clostridioides difficile]|nr:hypothetical protein [Clostridioides difficile]
MRVRKILSLGIAGILAIGMLTGCSMEDQVNQIIKVVQTRKI